MQAIIDWISTKEKYFVSLSRQIWQWAEVGLKEHNSAKLLSEELEKWGFSLQRGVAGLSTAFIATYGQGPPFIGLLAEYDALPGLSPGAEDPAGGRGGHGCGHNLLGVGSLAAALAIRQLMEERSLPSGTIKLFGTPGEETLAGKVFMAREGVFDRLDVALTWHPWDKNTVWAGTSLAINSVKFKFQGIAAHAAVAPDQGRSALDAVELMNIGVNYLREHIIPEARIHYVITKGGEAPNIVPAEAEVWYYIRAPKRAQVEQLFQRVKDIARGAALMTGTTLETDLLQGAHELLSNKALADLMYRKFLEIGPPPFREEELGLARSLLGDEPRKEGLLDDSIHPPDPGFVLPGSTDLGDVSWLVPTANLAVAAWPKGTVPHSQQACQAAGSSIGFKAMLVAAKVLALTAWELLQRPEELLKIREEFHRSTEDFEYRSPLPPEKRPPMG